MSGLFFYFNNLSDFKNWMKLLFGCFRINIWNLFKIRLKSKYSKPFKLLIRKKLKIKNNYSSFSSLAGHPQVKPICDGIPVTPVLVDI
jgi:hypothetical protein